MALETTHVPLNEMPACLKAELLLFWQSASNASAPEGLDLLAVRVKPDALPCT